MKSFSNFLKHYTISKVVSEQTQNNSQDLTFNNKIGQSSIFDTAYNNLKPNKDGKYNAEDIDDFVKIIHKVINDYDSTSQDFLKQRIVVNGDSQLTLWSILQILYGFCDNMKNPDEILLNLQKIGNKDLMDYASENNNFTIKSIKRGLIKYNTGNDSRKINFDRDIDGLINEFISLVNDFSFIYNKEAILNVFSKYIYNALPKLMNHILNQSNDTNTFKSIRNIYELNNSILVGYETLITTFLKGKPGLNFSQYLRRSLYATKNPNRYDKNMFPVNSGQDYTIVMNTTKYLREHPEITEKIKSDMEQWNLKHPDKTIKTDFDDIVRWFISTGDYWNNTKNNMKYDSSSMKNSLQNYGYDDNRIPYFNDQLLSSEISGIFTKDILIIFAQIFINEAKPGNTIHGKKMLIMWQEILKYFLDKNMTEEDVVKNINSKQIIDDNGNNIPITTNLNAIKKQVTFLKEYLHKCFSNILSNVYLLANNIQKYLSKNKIKEIKNKFGSIENFIKIIGERIMYQKNPHIFQSKFIKKFNTIISESEKMDPLDPNYSYDVSTYNDSINQSVLHSLSSNFASLGGDNKRTNKSWSYLDYLISLWANKRGNIKLDSTFKNNIEQEYQNEKDEYIAVFGDKLQGTPKNKLCDRIIELLSNDSNIIDNWYKYVFESYKNKDKYTKSYEHVNDETGNYNKIERYAPQADNIFKIGMANKQHMFRTFLKYSEMYKFDKLLEKYSKKQLYNLFNTEYFNVLSELMYKKSWDDIIKQADENLLLTIQKLKYNISKKIQQIIDINDIPDYNNDILNFNKTSFKKNISWSTNGTPNQEILSLQKFLKDKRDLSTNNLQRPLIDSILSSIDSVLNMEKYNHFFNQYAHGTGNSKFESYMIKVCAKTIIANLATDAGIPISYKEKQNLSITDSADEKQEYNDEEFQNQIVDGNTQLKDKISQNRNKLAEAISIYINYQTFQNYNKLKNKNNFSNDLMREELTNSFKLERVLNVWEYIYLTTGFKADSLFDKNQKITFVKLDNENDLQKLFSGDITTGYEENNGYKRLMSYLYKTKGVKTREWSTDVRRYLSRSNTINRNLADKINSGIRNQESDLTNSLSNLIYTYYNNINKYEDVENINLDALNNDLNNALNNISEDDLSLRGIQKEFLVNKSNIDDFIDTFKNCDLDGKKTIIDNNFKNDIKIKTHIINMLQILMYMPEYVNTIYKQQSKSINSLISFEYYNDVEQVSSIKSIQKYIKNIKDINKTFNGFRNYCYNIINSVKKNIIEIFQNI